MTIKCHCLERFVTGFQSEAFLFTLKPPCDVSGRVASYTLNINFIFMFESCIYLAFLVKSRLRHIYLCFSVSECMNCERVGFFPTMFCPQIEYGEFCYTKVVHNDSGIFTIKGYNMIYCETNRLKKIEHRRLENKHFIERLIFLLRKSDLLI